jgi:hypothetical protein
MGVGARQLYRLSSVVVGVLGGVIARAVFLRLWTRLTSSDDKPEPTDEDAGWSSVLVAAALEGALFAVVRAFLRRAEATGVARLTGEWPEDGA